MNNTEIREAMYRLQEMEFLLEEEYKNNGGEVTDYTETQEACIEALREMLTTDGVDSLGRWFKAKEDQIETLKAEKKHIERKIKGCERTIEFIKYEVNHVLKSVGLEKAKGTSYSFTLAESVTVELNKDELKAKYDQLVKEAFIKACIPAYIGCSLTASSTIAKEVGLKEGDENLFSEKSSPSVRFTKPRKAKEE